VNGNWQWKFRWEWELFGIKLGIEWEMGMLVWEREGMGMWNPLPLADL